MNKSTFLTRSKFTCSAAAPVPVPVAVAVAATDVSSPSVVPQQPSSWGCVDGVGFGFSLTCGCGITTLHMFPT